MPLEISRTKVISPMPDQMEVQRSPQSSVFNPMAKEGAPPSHQSTSTLGTLLNLQSPHFDPNAKSVLSPPYSNQNQF